MQSYGVIMQSYLVGFVVCYNLLPKDYEGSLIGRLEDEITKGISAIRENGFKLNNKDTDHILFSYPQNPDALVDSIPVVVDVTLFSDSHFKPGFVEHDGIRITVWKCVHHLFNSFFEKRKITVIVRRPNGAVSQYSGE